MAAVNLCGFESGSLIECGETSGATTTISSAVKRTGAYSLKLNPPSTGGTGYADFGAISANGALSTPADTTVGPAGTSYVRFYIYVAARPVASSEALATIYDSGGSSKLRLMFRSDGKLDMVRADGTTTGATVIPITTWTLIEMSVGSNSATSPWEVKIEGAVEGSGTTDTRFQNNHARVKFGKYFSNSNNGYEVYVDDFVWSDSAYPGPGSGVAALPTGDSVTNIGFTTGPGLGFNKFDFVNTRPPDDDTLYLTSTISGDVWTGTFAGHTAMGISGVATINAVKLFTDIRDEGGSSLIKNCMRYKSTNYFNATSRDPGATYVGNGTIYTLAPDGGAWAPDSSFDAMEMGNQNNANVAMRVTQVFIYVDFTEPPTPTGPPLGGLALLGVGR